MENQVAVRPGDVVDLVSETTRRAVYVAAIKYDGTVTGLPIEGDREFVSFNTEDVTWVEGSGLELPLEALHTS